MAGALLTLIDAFKSKGKTDMASVNKVILIGNLGKDPETRYLPSGEALTSFSIATSETWKDKTSGEKKEATEWHRISAFGKLAEICGEYLRKGSQVYIEGSLRTRKWQDKEGQDRYTTEIRADQMRMLGSRGGGEGSGGGGGMREPAAAPSGGGASKAPAKKSGGSFDDMDDDIPF